MNLLNSDLRVIYYLFIHFIKLPTIRSIIFIREQNQIQKISNEKNSIDEKLKVKLNVLITVILLFK